MDKTNKDIYYDIKSILDNPKERLNIIIDILESPIHEITVAYKNKMKENFLIKFSKDINKNKINRILEYIISWGESRANVSLVIIDNNITKKDYEDNDILCIPRDNMVCKYIITLTHEDDTKTSIIYECTDNMYMGEVSKLFTTEAKTLGIIKQIFIKKVNY